MIEVEVDAASAAAAGDRIVRRYLGAATRAVRGVTKGVEDALERETRLASPGTQLYRVWTSRAFPKTGIAREPAGEVFVSGSNRIRRAITFFTQPGTARGSYGQYLAIPLPAAGAVPRGGELTPGAWERRTGRRLRFVYRRGRPSLLVADDAVMSKRGGVARPNTARRIAAGRASATVPIFVLLPSVRFRNAFAIEPIVRRAQSDLIDVFARELAATATEG